MREAPHISEILQMVFNCLHLGPWLALACTGFQWVAMGVMAVHLQNPSHSVCKCGDLALLCNSNVSKTLVSDPLAACSTSKVKLCHWNKKLKIHAILAKA